ncbi:MAG: hypothetical protein ACLFS9_03095 [Nitriliruptoraceae bacterium]
MPRSPGLLAALSPEQRRTRLLTTLTLLAGAATIAAVGATSTAGSDPRTEEAGGGTATLDRPAGADDGRGADAHDPSAPDTSAVAPLDALTPLDGLDDEPDDGVGPVDPQEAERDPDAPTERVAEVEPLPRLDRETTQAADEEALRYVAADGTEVTPERIRAFLDGRGAPLAEHAELFVEAGLRHDVDPRVVVAISIAESNGGKMHPQGTHNVWGWGGSGGPSGLRAWDSWEQAIDGYTERLGALYDTDDVDWEFASTYCPPNTQWWYDTVTWAIAQI